MVENTTTSLWLKPEGSTYDILSQIITDLADEHGSPVFEPHVTLLGGLNIPTDDIIKKLDGLAASSHPIGIQLGKIGYKDNFYQSFFAHVMNNDVYDLRRLCNQTFEKQDTEKFMPHLSLMYHEMPESKKEVLAERLGGSIDHIFTATKIHVMSTSGPPSKWKEISSFNLKT